MFQNRQPRLICHGFICATWSIYQDLPSDRADWDTPSRPDPTHSGRTRHPSGSIMEPHGATTRPNFRPRNPSGEITKRNQFQKCLKKCPFGFRSFLSSKLILSHITSQRVIFYRNMFFHCGPRSCSGWLPALKAMAHLMWKHDQDWKLDLWAKLLINQYIWPQKTYGKMVKKDLFLNCLEPRRVKVSESHVEKPHPNDLDPSKKCWGLIYMVTFPPNLV